MSEERTQEPVHLPRIGDPAPGFEAPSSQGTIRLDDFKGKWVVLFSHPSDFTPVCTTEFVEFARRAPEFQGMGAQLVGLSVDSVYSHIAWIRNIEEKFEVEVTFPVIADLSTDVSRKYGMIHAGEADTATVRAVFLIDPEQRIRALLYYPMSAGRAVSEIQRLLQALQLNAAHGLATPQGWTPGEACIVPPPATQAEASDRLKRQDLELTDWYLARTPAPE